MRDRTTISDALENHEENKNKDLSSTICEFVSLECTPQVRYTVELPHPLRFESKKGANASGTEKLVDGKQHSVWFVPTGMNRLPQNVLLNFWLEFPKSDHLPFTIHLEFPKFSVKW